MSTTKQEVDHVHEAHIQETKQEADIEWVKLHLCPSERHLCPRFEALETGQTEAEVMEATFKKQMEHKKNRVQPEGVRRARYRAGWGIDIARCSRCSSWA